MNELAEEFASYLFQKKKINAECFASEEPERYAEWLALFSAVSIKNFEQQKLYLINPLRRRFRVEDESKSS